jgi:hypothetical protein
VDGLDDHAWRSIAYALVEGVVLAIEISRDDIDATCIKPTPDAASSCCTAPCPAEPATSSASPSD